MSQIICFIKGIYRSIRCGAFVSGHEYKTIKEKTPPNIHILKCSICGKEDFGWSRESLEQYK